LRSDLHSLLVIMPLLVSRVEFAVVGYLVLPSILVLITSGQPNVHRIHWVVHCFRLLGWIVKLYFIFRCPICWSWWATVLGQLVGVLVIVFKITVSSGAI
jgi:hypothetical protein